jgi:hypothetical protein
MKFLSLTPFALLASIVYAAPSELEIRGLEKRATTPPKGITVTGVTFSGTGCPAGSVGTFLSADGSTYTLIFDSFTAAVNAGAAAVNTVGCSVKLALKYPNGYSMSVSQQTYRGSVQLDSKVTAAQSATYNFGLPIPLASASSQFTGPVDQDFTRTENVTLAALALSPCNGAGTLTINTSLSVSNRANSAGQGIFTESSQDGKLTSQLGLQWYKC